VPDAARNQLRSYDRVADVYDATRGFPPGVEDAVAARLVALIGQRSLLEVGIGTGRVAVPLAARGVAVTGFDISRPMLLKLIEKRADIAVILAESSRPPFRDGSFDAVLFVHVLHLVPDADATILAAIPLIAPGGLMLACYTEHNRTAVSDANAVMQLEIGRQQQRQPDEWRDRTYRWSDRFIAQTAAAGARTGSVVLAEWDESTTARALLDTLAARANSQTWALSDETVASVIGNTRNEVIRICGGLDNPIVSHGKMVAVVARF
jgi:ubiquinone/menaquinone biosynthesis C-methylase UbiE